jgi:hypothetical protein
LTGWPRDKKQQFKAKIKRRKNLGIENHSTNKVKQLIGKITRSPIITQGN